MGAVPGLATHNFGVTYEKLKAMGVQVPLLMVPVNANGFMMRPSKEKCEAIIRDINGTVLIGKKILAGGCIQPKDAIEYVINDLQIPSIAIGIASVSECQQSFSAAQDVMGEKYSETIEVE
jgi:hypothetical protein